MAVLAGATFGLVACVTRPEPGDFAATEAQSSPWTGVWGCEQARAFARDRVRLGPRFDAALRTHVGEESSRLYWAGWFLTSTHYLEGLPARPELALELWDKGMRLAAARPDAFDVDDEITFAATAALLCAQQGWTPKAIRYKERVRTLARQTGRENAEFAGWIALDDDERVLFEAIP